MYAGYEKLMPLASKEKLERGIGCLQPPMGYTIVKQDKILKFVINEIGKNCVRHLSGKLRE